MTGLAAGLPNLRPSSSSSWVSRSPVYYGWVNLMVAALAMVGTLPGRTQGLGLITEPLMRDFHIDRVSFAQINLWATLIGALFSLGVGRMIDRFGSRVVLTAVAAMLGVTVLLISGATGIISLILLITLTRGIGQSALSVVSITIIGQWFQRRLSLAMGIYTVVLSVGFMGAFPAVGAAVINSGWRVAWAGIGTALLFGLAPLAWLLVRRTPESCGIQIDGESSTALSSFTTQTGSTLGQALATPAFWVFAMASATYGLIASGIGLFNESILAERGFDASIYHRTLVITALTALLGNFVAGWLASKWSLSRLMALAMLLLTGSLMALPHVRTEAHVAAYAVVMGLAGGFVIVLFFTFWSHAYGRAQLGKIQGAAQALTVVGSAVGPLLLAKCVELTGSYSLIFYLLAIIVAGLSICAWFVPIPEHRGTDNGGIEMMAAP
ncbi:MAG: MFS transporter [Acidobacteriota bacterium]|nr:MFS transporter [Acidobacteriota bacterium]